MFRNDRRCRLHQIWLKRFADEILADYDQSSTAQLIPCYPANAKEVETLQVMYFMMRKLAS